MVCEVLAYVCDAGFVCSCCSCYCAASFPKTVMWTEAHTTEGYHIILYIKLDHIPLSIMISGRSITANYINHHPQI